jgi:hypothetical protein
MKLRGWKKTKTHSQRCSVHPEYHDCPTEDQQPETNSALLAQLLPEFPRLSFETPERSNL